MNVVLLGLTGMANPVLEALSARPGLRVTAVFTRRYEHPYPFYPEIQLEDLCRRMDVPCHAGVRVSGDSGFDLLAAAAPDLVLVATFHQVLAPRVLALPPPAGEPPGQSRVRRAAARGGSPRRSLRGRSQGGRAHGRAVRRSA